MSDNEKVTMIKKCVYKATQDEHFSPSTPRLFRQHDFDEFISETWLRVAAVLSDVDKLTARNEKRAAQGKKSLTLVSIVYNGARASIAAIAYADSKHAAASDFEVMNDNGECFSYGKGGDCESAEKERGEHAGKKSRDTVFHGDTSYNALISNWAFIIFPNMLELDIGVV